MKRSLWVLALCASAAPVRADSPPACAASYERAQRLRKSGALVEAHREAITCAQASCPAILRQDCVGWVAELDAAIPTVTVDVREADGASANVTTIEVDGVPAAVAPGRALRVDPGPHSFRATLADGRSVEGTLVAREGLHHQPLRLTLAPPPAPAAPPATDTPPPPRPLAPITVGTFALAATGTAVFFAARGFDRLSDLDRCKPGCPPAARDPIERDFLVADLAGALALVGAGVATWLWWRGRVEAAATPGGLTLAGRF